MLASGLLLARVPQLSSASGRLLLRPAAAAMTSAAVAAAPAPPVCLHLTYTYTADILERRGPYRPAHLAAARSLVEAGKLLMAGAFVDDGPAGAVFVFAPGATRAEVDAFVAADPYVCAGLVVASSVRSWATPLSAPALNL